MEASSTAIRNTRSRRLTTGHLHAIPDPRIRTGSSSRPAAADRTRGAAWIRWAAVAAALAVLTFALGRDAGPRRFVLRPVGFDQLSGWVDDHHSAAVPAFRNSCARFL